MWMWLSYRFGLVQFPSRKRTQEQIRTINRLFRMGLKHITVKSRDEQERVCYVRSFVYLILFRIEWKWNSFQEGKEMRSLSYRYFMNPERVICVCFH